MAEIQNELGLQVGNEEAASLKPAPVKVAAVKVEVVGKKNSKKLVCECKHPEKAELIHISAVKCEKAGKLDTIGLWINKDNEGLLQKGSALAVFLQSTGSKTPGELVGKEIATTTDDKGYLCFKAY